MAAEMKPDMSASEWLAEYKKMRKRGKSYKYYVFCSWCNLWLPRIIQNDYCPNCNRRTRKGPRSKMAERKGLKRE